MTQTIEEFSTYVPHSGEMVLLDTIDSVAETSLVARTVVRADGLFNVSANQVPSFISVEYMAQAVAAWAGFHGLARGESVQPGLLLGVRDFRASTPNMQVGDQLTVSVEQVMQTPNGLAVFDARTESANLNISARLSVLTVKSLDEMHALVKSS